MDFIQSLFGFLVAIIILVTVHEFGHFYVARLCGVKVLRFCVGIGKPFWSTRDKHGTEFALAPFPIGGYVKMLGDEDDEVAEADRHRTLESQALWQRIAILAAGPVANFILAIVVFAGLFLSGVTQRAPVIGEVENGSEAAFSGLEVGQEIIAVDGEPTPSLNAVLERMMLRLGETGYMTVTVKYPESTDLDYDVRLKINNWLREAEEPDPFKGIGVRFARPKPLTTMAKIWPDSAAERAGLRIGDKIVSADGVAMVSWQQWVDHVRPRADQTIALDVDRAGTIQRISLTPEKFVLADGQIIGRVGVSPEFEPWPDGMLRQIQYSPLAAVKEAVEKTWSTSVGILVSIKKLLTLQISPKHLSGPIGIATVAGDYVRAGMEPYISFLAILSVYLGVFNLLPIPILDGGRILYYLIEGVKGSPLSERVKLAGLQAGLAMLAAVMVMAFYNDILRLIAA